MGCALKWQRLPPSLLFSSALFSSLQRSVCFLYADTLWGLAVRTSGLRPDCGEQPLL